MKSYRKKKLIKIKCTSNGPRTYNGTPTLTNEKNNIFTSN